MAFNNPFADKFPVVESGGGEPSGPAGGDLAGNYPNPTVIPATTTDAGKVILAENNGVVPNTVVRADDPRILGITAIPENRFIGRGFGGGAGAPQPLSAATPSQFSFTPTTFTLVENLNQIGNASSGSVKPAYIASTSSPNAGTQSSSESTLKTLTVVAGSLFADGYVLFGAFAGAFTITSGQTANIRIYIGGVLLLDSLVSLFPAGSWYVQFDCIRSSSNNLRCVAKFISDDGGSAGISECALLNITFNPNAALQITLRALVSNALVDSVTCGLGRCNAAKNN